MKCPHCGGSLIPEPGDYMNEPALKCMSCGRRPVRASGPEERRVHMEQTRKCRKCQKEYPLTAEYFHRMGDGFVNHCKPCRSEMQKEYKRKDKKSSVVPASNKNQRVMKTRVAKRPVDPSRIPTTKATPAEILIALRRGMAQEIVDVIREKYDL